MADEIKSADTTVTPETPAVETPVVAPVTPTVAPVQPATPTPETPVAPATPTEPVFTQEQLNKAAGLARKEGKDVALKDLMKELGVTDKESLKAALDAERVRKAAEMSETERLQAELETFKAAAEQAEQSRIATENSAKNALLSVELSKYRDDFNDIGDLKMSLNMADVVIDLETQTVTGVAEQAKKILKDKPHYAKVKVQSVTVPPSPKPNQPNTAEIKDEARRKAWKPSF